MKVVIQKSIGSSFAENKEQAKRLRTKFVLPALRRKEDIELDFEGVTLATQSFIHALIAEAVRDGSLGALDRIAFSHCSDNVRSVIEIVVSYAQDDWSTLIEIDQDEADERDGGGENGSTVGS